MPEVESLFNLFLFPLLIAHCQLLHIFILVTPYGWVFFSSSKDATFCFSCSLMSSRSKIWQGTVPPSSCDTAKLCDLIKAGTRAICCGVQLSCWLCGTRLSPPCQLWQLPNFYRDNIHERNTYIITSKHRKNCECCPGHYLIVNHYSSI